MAKLCCMWLSPWMPVTLMMNAMAEWSQMNRDSANCRSKDRSRSGCRETSRPADTGSAGSAKDLVDTAVEAGRFTRLVDALKAADLVSTLKSKGPFTVFAPSDEAFSKLPSEAVQSLLRDTEALRKTLKSHVVTGRFRSTDLGAIDALRTASGEVLKVDLSDGVRIGNARVVQADLATANGVIHVIDTVLLPQAG